MNKTDDFDERDALTRAAGGDQHAFRVIFDTYHRRVYTFALRYLKSAHHAEEAVQEVFMKLWRQGAALDGIDDLQQFLFTITRNHALDSLRRMKVREHVQLPLQDNHDAASTDTEDAIVLNETRRILEEGIGKLPPQQQRVYRLCHQQGLTYNQAAQQLSLSEQTVKRHMKLALRFLRTYLEKHGVAGILWVLLKLF